MSHFYGTIYGPGGPKTQPTIARYGGAVESGLEAVLGSVEGRVSVRLSEGEAPDGGLEDRVRIVFNDRLPREFILYEGPLSECLYSGIYTNTQEVEK